MSVVGSNVPECMSNMFSEDVVFYNHVSDSELVELYLRSSVCIIPLRFGAGVKGKTLEAMHNSIPIVSTSVGIEGMPGIENYICPKDDATSFASEVVKILKNHNYASELGFSYSTYVSKYYSVELLKNIFS